MKTKMLLIMSGVLNATLLGVAVYLTGQIPKLDQLPVQVRFVAQSASAGHLCSTSPRDVGPRFDTCAEVLLPGRRNPERPQLFDLETGRCLTEPDFEFFGNNGKANIAWLRINGFDLSGMVLDDATAMGICYYLAIVPVAPQRWDDATPEEILAHADLNQILDPKRTVIRSSGFPPATFLFRTVEGNAGILQMLGVTGDRRHVRMRYKLVKPLVAAPESGGVWSTAWGHHQPG